MLRRRKSKDGPPGPVYMNTDQMNNYLSELRSNRPARPTGARPPPSSFRSVRHSVVPSPTVELPEAEGEKDIGWKSVKTASTRRVSGHRKTSSTSQIPTRSKDIISHTGRSLVRAPTSPLKVDDGQSGRLACQENGAGWTEKQEGKALRLALQQTDMSEEEKLHADAQKEASDLVWKHQHPSAATRDSHAPYRYSEHSQEGSVNKRPGVMPDGVMVRKGRIERGSGTGSRSASGESDSAATTSSSSSRIPSDGSMKSVTSRASRMRRRSSQFAATIIKKGEEKLEAIRPAMRKVSGAKETMIEVPPSKVSEQPAPRLAAVSEITSSFGSVHARNPFSRVRTARSSLSRPESCPPGEIKRPYLERVEIQRNPPTQSRNPGYTASTSRPGTPLGTPKPSEEKTRLKAGKEIRDEEIRKATSMSLRDRSPKLPTPTMVSNAPGRPIVSFKDEWDPKEVKLKQETPPSVESASLKTKPTSKGNNTPQGPTISFSSVAPAPPSRANTFPLVNTTHSPSFVSSIPPVPTISITETPLIRSGHMTPSPIPTISVSDDVSPRPLARPVPSISINSAPSISVSPPTISVSTPPTISIVPLPSISISDPSVSISDNAGSSSRPLPTPGHSKRQRPHWAVPTQASARSSVLCNECAMPISGRIVTAAGVRFHPTCFRCHHCAEALECVAFFPEPDNKRVERLATSEHDDGLRFYCHLDYHEFFSPRCKSCKTPIEGDVIVACGAEWHAGHFFCAQCGDPFEATTPFVEKDGYAWCTGCHTNRFSTKCKKCRKPVTDMVVKALGAEWHDSCFCCNECGSKFDDGRYFLREGEEEPVCPSCEERRLKA